MNKSSCGLQLQKASSKSSQVEDPFYSATIANVVFSGCLCYITIMLNVVTIYALRKTSALSKPLKAFLQSLALSDLGVGLLGQPLNIAYLVALLRCNSSDRAILIARRVVLNFLCLSSFFSIMALGTERFIAIRNPLRYQDIVTQKRVFTAVIAIWSLSAFLELSALLVLPDNIFILIFLIIVFACFVTTTWSSYRIYLIVRHHNIQIQATVQQVSENSEVVKISSTRRSAYSALLIYLAFWVCYLPRSSILIVRQTQARKSVAVDILNMFSLTLVLLNSSVNPIIYCWTMRSVRHTIMKILRNIFRSQ